MPQNIFKILDGRGSFWQWDLNQRITADWLKVGDIIHVTNDKQPTAPMLKAYDFNGTVVVDVPNILLQDILPISAYRYIEDGDAAATINKFIFKVRQRPRPDGYVYTETEILTYHQLDERITYLEENGTGGGGGSKITVDQTFIPTSKNPQSGIAVAEALGNMKQLVVNAGYFSRMEELQKYNFEEGVVYILRGTDDLNNINMNDEFIGTVRENILYCFRSSLYESFSIDLTKGEVVDYYNSADHPFETCDIDNYEDLLGYPFKANKLYKLNVITNIHSLIPIGCYIGRYFYDKDVWDADILEFTTFIPDGKVRIVVFETGECLTRDADVVKSVNGRTGDVQLKASDVGALSENDIRHTFIPNDKKPISSQGFKNAINLVMKKSTGVESFDRLFNVTTTSSFDPCFVKVILSNDLVDHHTFASLPKGTYLCAASDENHIACWDIENGLSYRIKRDSYGEYYYNVNQSDGQVIIKPDEAFSDLPGFKDYPFVENKLYLCQLIGVLPNGLRDFDLSLVKLAIVWGENNECVSKKLNIVDLFNNRYATVDLLTDEVIVTNYEEKIANIENTLNELGTLENGKSAYEIAVDNGFKGTEAEWLYSLKGDVGVGIYTVEKNIDNELIVVLTDGSVIELGNIKGDRGPQGEKGDKGEDGVGIDEVYILDGNLYVKKSTDTEAINLGSVKGDPATNIVQSVNGYTGIVKLTASDVGALSKDEGTQMTEQIQTINTTLQGLEDFLATI